MCGIFGIISSSAEVDSNLFLNALKSIKHRGPDYLGTHSDGPIIFGHARLSILDLDPRSNQPMVLDSGNLALTYNGEIFNFIEIKKELESEGYTFHTSSDTEVILVGYNAWGLEKFISKAIGMFAFGLFDKKLQKVFLVRDRFGKKPLFYFKNQKAFSFASEVSPLFKYFRDFKLNPAGLDAYLTLNFSPYNEHLVDGVKSIPPGCYGVYDLREKNLSLHRYWNPFIEQPLRKKEYCVEELEAELQRAVKIRLVSDVPVCGFLSGGIDSSLISALVAKNSSLPYRTYCIGYEGQDQYNEFEYADLVAKKYALDHNNILVSLDEAKKIVTNIGDLLDEPISNWVWVPLYLLSKKVRSDNYKVVLMGEGADELFHGYNSFTQALKTLERVKKNPARYTFPHHLLGFAATLTDQGHRRFDLWRRVSSGDPTYMGTSFGITQTLRNHIAGEALKEKGVPSAGYDYIKFIQDDLLKKSGGDFDDVDLIAYTEIYSKMIEVLVRRVDRITMLNSIEARCPFLDHKLAELVFKTRGLSRIDGNVKKAWLKKVAQKYIPYECIDRKKMGFSFPFQKWLHGDLGDVVFERFKNSKIFQDGWLNQNYCLKILKDHKDNKRDYAPRIWSLYTLSTWYDRWM